jgi:hypothetical protein
MAAAQELRTLLTPIAKAHGFRLSVRKAAASMGPGALSVDACDTVARRVADSVPCRVAMLEAMLAAGFDSVFTAHGMPFASHALRLSVEHGHGLCEFSVVKLNS